MGDSRPFVTISEWQPTGDGNSFSSGDSAVRRDRKTARPQARSRLIASSQYGSSIEDEKTPAATHDISRVSYHVKHLPEFAKTLEDVRSNLSLYSSLYSLLISVIVVLTALLR